MTVPVVLTALRIEARAVRRGLSGARVIRTGMGPRRAGAAARRLAARLEPGVPVVVAGFCGALTAGVRPGDVVVATAVTDAGTGRTWTLAEAGPPAEALTGALAGALAEALRPPSAVRTGTVATTRRPVLTAAGRARLAAGGAVAADTESAAVLAALDGRHPVAVVRVVTDGPGAGLASPRLVGRALAARRVLTEAAAVLDVGSSRTKEVR